MPTVGMIQREDLEAEQRMGDPLPVPLPTPSPPSAQLIPAAASTQGAIATQHSPPLPTLIDPNSRPSTLVNSLRRLGKGVARPGPFGFDIGPSALPDSITLERLSDER